VVVGVEVAHGDETIIAATRQARACLCPVEEINYLAGPGKGVILIKVAKDDRVIGFRASHGDRDLLEVITGQGNRRTISTAKYEVTGRGGKGRQIMKRGKFARIEKRQIELVSLEEQGA
jgi:DNA gyrase subunit A